MNSEQDKKYNNLKWQFALKNSNIGIWDYNADLGRVFYSEESKEIIGFDSDEFGSNPNDWNDRVHPDDREKYYKDFQDHLNGIKPIYHNEHRIKCKDGSYKWVSDKGKIVEWTDQGEPKRIIGTHTDITERKKRETELSSNLNIITNQNKQLLNFAHIVSHNLRTHSGNIESLIQFYEDAETNRDKNDYFNHIKNVSSSLFKTITELEDVVKIQNEDHVKIETLSLFTYVDNTLSILMNKFESSNTKIELDVPAEITINFKKSYLESILQNLLTNAIKYRKPDVNPEISITATETDSSVLLKVKDNGIGIDLEKYGEKLFGMYNTFHNKTEYDSRGIGLYLTRNQLKAYNGNITVESKLGVGSTFIVSFKK